MKSAMMSFLHGTALVLALRAGSATMHHNHPFASDRPRSHSPFLAGAVFVLEHLERLNALLVPEGRLDEKHVGFYGHSFGRALAMQAARRRPDLLSTVSGIR